MKFFTGILDKQKLFGSLKSLDRKKVYDAGIDPEAIVYKYKALSIALK